MRSLSCKSSQSVRDEGNERRAGRASEPRSRSEGSKSEKKRPLHLRGSEGENAYMKSAEGERGPTYRIGVGKQEKLSSFIAYQSPHGENEQLSYLMIIDVDII